MTIIKQLIKKISILNIELKLNLIDIMIRLK